ncbi:MULTISPECIES: hypothetical protein [Vibrio]|jgi:hypothetical protein|uniref:Uncharacterized protein n=2 Tax=Vibrio TaxID=662 RepID=A0A0H4A2M9_9VIBR|nr:MULTISPECIES: hypothetical protein [Vibrio]AKN40051.1 hypothetical protein [Vibrio tasmaniensis]AKN36740.1 hypothetical protein [Vibrio splendidus]AKN39228.1 hypothetical protein [Vibrio splendidus]OEE68501.1 hypothetical protein A147_16200 [Vibrio splendidus FF-6]OEF75568.1 hypothetical protein OA5_05375 [Vibrio cyclitrophicus 1F111]
MSKLEELERLLSDDFSAIEETFNGTYGSELTKLSGLSISDLKKINPEINVVEYEKLKAVVLRASQQNLSQAELKMRIQALGETAVKIANIADIII